MTAGAPATSMTMNPLDNPEAIDVLRGQLAGRVVTPGDADYDQARTVWNGMIDRYPALVASCETEDDVIAAVAFARAHALPVAVRGGGHSVAGHSTCDGGIVIDLSPMKAITVDADARVAQAGAGVTWGELDAATQQFGLAAPGGVFSRTGIAGLTLGGGFGWLGATYGLSCDNLIAARVVTADGQVALASEQTGDQAELLWGLRGGGGNFGVVTQFSYRLHPVGPASYLAAVFHDGEGETAVSALRFCRDYCASAPAEVNLIASCGIIPAHAELFPEPTHGRRFVFLGAHYVGPVEAGERALQPLFDFAEPLVDFSGVLPFVDIQQFWDADYPDGMRYYWKSLNLPRLDDDAIARIVTWARQQPSALSTVDLWHVGAGIKRGSPGGSAFRGRDAAFLLNLEANWVDPADDEQNVRWVRDCIADMESFSDGSRYLNFAGFLEEGDALMRTTFGSHYARLAALKRRYDPTNLFKLNQNINPAGA